MYPCDTLPFPEEYSNCECLFCPPSKTLGSFLAPGFSLTLYTHSLIAQPFWWVELRYFSCTCSYCCHPLSPLTCTNVLAFHPHSRTVPVHPVLLWQVELLLSRAGSRARTQRTCSLSHGSRGKTEPILLGLSRASPVTCSSSRLRREGTRCKLEVSPLRCPGCMAVSGRTKLSSF